MAGSGEVCEAGCGEVGGMAPGGSSVAWSGGRPSWCPSWCHSIEAAVVTADPALAAAAAMGR